MAKGDWQRALAAAGEITEAWLTDEDADLSDHIDAAIEQDGHDIVYARVKMFGPCFALSVPEPSASSLGRSREACRSGLPNQVELGRVGARQLGR